MNNIDKFIKDVVSRELQSHESFDNTIYATFQNLENRPKKRKIHHLKLDLAIACCFMFIITGVVFAKEIENFVKAGFENFGLGRGVDTAIDNGYVGKPEMEDEEFQNVPMLENNEVIDNIDVKVKIDEFLMTDTNLSLDFYFEFENKICDYVSLGETINGNVDYEGSHIIGLSDLFIVDENNEVLYFERWDCENFKEYCKNNNMDFDYPEYSIHNLPREYNKDEDYMKVNNIYYITGEFPKSKKLDIYFTKINLENDAEILSEKNLKNITLKGNWHFSLDVPENIYNRTHEDYKVVSCDNKDFNVYEAKLSDTRLEIGIEIANVEEVKYPPELDKIDKEAIETNGENYKKSFKTREDVVEFYGSEEYADLFEDYFKNTMLFDNIINYFYPWIDYKNEGSYAINSNGEKFKIMIGGFDSNSYKDNKKFDCRCTCDITKYDSYTDKITLVIYFKDEPVKIELERINN